MSLKQVVVVRQDLRLQKGKLAVQVAHACFEAASRTDKTVVSEWKRAGGKKVVLKVPDEKAMLTHMKKAEDSGLVVALIRDAGKTQVEPGTATCFAIGPDKEEKIDEITGELGMV